MNYVIILFIIFIFTLVIIQREWKILKYNFKENEILIIGHRGAPAYGKENTISSFHTAIEQNADGIEIDVQMTKDKKIIIYHDYFIKEEQSKVVDLSLDQIKKIKFQNSRGLPTLNDIVPLLDKIRILNIEIKSNQICSRGIEKDIINFINENNIKDKTIISSFNPLVLRRVKNIDNGIWAGYLYSKVDVPMILKTYIWIYFVRPDSFHPDFNFTNKKKIEWAKKKGMKTFIFTINSKSQYTMVKSWGVNGIFTDNPKKLKQIQCD